MILVVIKNLKFSDKYLKRLFFTQKVYQLNLKLVQNAIQNSSKMEKNKFMQK